MQTRILAGAALVLAIALGGCATNGATNTFASTTPLVRQDGPHTPPVNADSGTRYRVFPDDTNVTPTPIGGS